ncbi:MAG: amidase, partial [Acidimicrobiales bacterium]|nr:amidase [Acidimicrobiales bacterium]
MDFREIPVVTLSELIRSKQISAREVMEIAIKNIEEINPKVNAFVALDLEKAADEAKVKDEEIARGESVGVFTGIPLGVKDLEDAKGFKTTHGSALFANDPVKQKDSNLVKRLRAAGAIVVGKTNTPELGWKPDTENTTFGPTRNPWNLKRSPGGSSGGSAAAIASGMVPIATGSDGGGSIRIPSAACGLSAFKPSLGRVPTGGSDPADWKDLSTKGVMARRISDIVALLDVVVGPEPSDLRSLPMPEGAWAGALDGAHVPALIAWSPNLGYGAVDDEIKVICQDATSLLEELGARVVEIDSVFDEDPISKWLCEVAVYSSKIISKFEGSELMSQV